MKLILLVGGKSERFGRDKSLEPRQQFNSAFDHAAHLATACNLAYFASGRTGDLPTHWTGIADRQPHCGPLVGIVSSLTYCQDDVLTIACDLPRLSHNTLTWLITQAALHPDVDAIVPTRDDQSLYQLLIIRLSALPALNHALTEGVRSIHKGLGSLRCIHLNVPRDLEGTIEGANEPDAWR